MIKDRSPCEGMTTCRGARSRLRCVQQLHGVILQKVWSAQWILWFGFSFASCLREFGTDADQRADVSICSACRKHRARPSTTARCRIRLTVPSPKILNGFTRGSRLGAFASGDDGRAGRLLVWPMGYAPHPAREESIFAVLGESGEPDSADAVDPPASITCSFELASSWKV